MFDSARRWPSLKLAAHAVPHAGAGVRPDLLGTAPDPAGCRVVTYNHWPLYTYVGDLTPGQATGQALDLNGAPLVRPSTLRRTATHHRNDAVTAPHPVGGSAAASPDQPSADGSSGRGSLSRRGLLLGAAGVVGVAVGAASAVESLPIRSQQAPPRQPKT